MKGPNEMEIDEILKSVDTTPIADTDVANVILVSAVAKMMSRLVDRMDAVIRKMTLTVCPVCDGDSYVGNDEEGDPVVCAWCHGTGWLNEDERAAAEATGL